MKDIFTGDWVFFCFGKIYTLLKKCLFPANKKLFDKIYKVRYNDTKLATYKNGLLIETINIVSYTLESFIDDIFIGSGKDSD